MQTALICLYWNERPLKASEYVAWIGSYLRGLKDIHATFAGMLVIDPATKKAAKLPTVNADAEAIVLSALPRDWAYLSPEGKREPAMPESRSRNGFLNAFATNIDYEAEGAVIEASVGALDAHAIDSIVLRVRGVELADPSLIRKLFKYSVLTCAPAYACATTEAFQVASNVDEIPLGWLTYVKGLPEALPLSEGVESRQMAEGRVLEIRGGERPHTSDYAARLSSLRFDLASAGLLADPLG